MTVPSPPKMNVLPSAADIPYGAGRPVRPDPSDQPFVARAEIHRDQKPAAGRPTIFKDADELKHACGEYFIWVGNNPWLAEKAQFASKQGQWEKTDVNKKRPYTQGALCVYLGIPTSTWISWRKMDKFCGVVKEVEETIYNQKFEGAAAGFFNPNIIARALGLVDRQEVTGANGGPIEKITTTMTPAKAAEAYAKTRENL